MKRKKNTDDEKIERILTESERKFRKFLFWRFGKFERSGGVYINRRG